MCMPERPRGFVRTSGGTVYPRQEAGYCPIRVRRERSNGFDRGLLEATRARLADTRASVFVVRLESVVVERHSSGRR